jgi:hypothetical protein
MPDRNGGTTSHQPPPPPPPPSHQQKDIVHQGKSGDEDEKHALLIVHTVYKQMIEELGSDSVASGSGTSSTGTATAG